MLGFTISSPSRIFLNSGVGNFRSISLLSVVLKVITNVILNGAWTSYRDYWLIIFYSSQILSKSDNMILEYTGAHPNQANLMAICGNKVAGSLPRKSARNWKLTSREKEIACHLSNPTNLGRVEYNFTTKWLGIQAEIDHLLKKRR